MRGLPSARFGLLYLVVVAVVFGPALLSSRTFGLRDAGHYYGPLWRYVNRQWRDGVPMWNALEENGRPLAADATASVFYPLKVLFALPVGFDTAMELYLVAHVFLAAGGAFFAARTFRLSRQAAGLAALSYGLSGPVVFLHCNAVFLVGAAWLPIGIGLLQRWFQSSPLGHGWGSMARAWYWRSMLGLAAVLAMMVLGGDPQAAYLLTLVGLVRVLVSAAQGSARRLTQLIGLGGVSLGALVLAAVQVLPSYQWSLESERAMYDAPRTFTELMGEIVRGEPSELSGLLDSPKSGSHRAAIYEFSVGPWRWAELLWPNFGGRPFPENQRWIAAVPAEGRYWTPTLYIGLLPALLGLTAIRRSNWSHLPRRWLIVTALFFALASLGQYGIAWLVSEVRLVLGAYPPERWGPVGGLYWLMTTVLPGFVLFRYPAKLWIVVTISLSLLAAVQADQLVRCKAVRIQRMMATYLLLCLVPLCGVLLVGIWPHWLSVPVDVIYGPFDVDGAVVGLVLAVIHGAVVAVATWWVSRREQKARHALLRWIVFITAVDLMVAHAWLVPTVPKATEKSVSSLFESEKAVPERYLHWTAGGWYPQRWSIESGRNRVSELVEWDRRTLRPKHNLDVSMNALQSSTSLSSANHRAVIDLIYERSEDRSHSFYRLLDVLGTRYVISPADQLYLSHLTFDSAVEMSLPMEQSANVWRNETAYPKAWIAHRVRRLNPPHSRRRQDRRRYIRDALLIPADELRQTVILDDERDPEPTVSTEQHKSTLNNVPDFCEVESQRGGSIVLNARLSKAGYVVVCESYDPGWTCVVQPEEGEKTTASVLRANGVMCAIALPAGQYRLTMRYRPASFLIGATLSVLSWSGWIALVLVAWRRWPRLLDTKPRSV